MQFKFFDYIFPNDLTLFNEYLIEHNIKTKTRKNQIIFEINNEYCKVPIRVLATFKDEKITRLELYCRPISFNNRKKIEEEIDSNFKLIERNFDASTSYYESDDYAIKMINPEHIWLDVQFERIIENKRVEDIIHKKKIIIFTTIGIIMSTLFIFLYFKFKSNILLNITTATLAISYAIFQFYYLYLKDSYKSRGVKIAICIVIPFIYIILLVVLSILLVVRLEDINNIITYINILDILFVFVYLSPSFHILLLVVALLSYI